MRIVRIAATFALGTVLALAWNLAPGHSIPVPVFIAMMTSCVLLIPACVILRRTPAPFILLIFLMLGMWRATDELTIHNSAETKQQDQPYQTRNIDHPTGSLQSLRLYISESLRKSIGGDAGGLATALINGDRSGLSSQTIGHFRSAGLAHVLAISGLHISLIGGIIMTASAIAIGKQRRLYLIAPLIAVAIYASLAGFHPPVSRAAIMFTVFVTAQMLGRGSHALPAISLAAAVMIAIDPAILVSLSFQLSFAATIGIALIAPRLESIAQTESSGTDTNPIWNRLRRFAVGGIIVSVAANIATAPLIALNFQALPVWGPFATLLVAPLMPLAILGSMLAVLIGTVAPDTLTNIVAIPPSIAATYIIRVAELFASIPPKPIQTGDWTPWLVALYYLMMITIAAFYPQTRSLVRSHAEHISRILTNLKPRILQHPINLKAPYLLSLSLLPIAASMWLLASFGQDIEQDQRLSVTFIQLTRGESIFIQTPNGKRIVIDAGNHPYEAADILQTLIPPWDRRVDLLLLTHPDADHLGGMKEITQRFEIGHIFNPNITSQTDVYADWQDVVAEHESVITPRRGMRIGIDTDTYLEILAAGCHATDGICSNINNASVVAKLIYRDISFMLTADIESSAELQLTSQHSQDRLRSTVLKVPHHGSLTSTAQHFLDTVAPAVAVLTIGTNNPFGHPHPQVRERLESTVGQERLFRTDTQGTTVIHTDGHRLWVEQ